MSLRMQDPSSRKVEILNLKSSPNLVLVVICKGVSPELPKTLKSMVLFLLSHEIVVH